MLVVVTGGDRIGALRQFPQRPGNRPGQGKTQDRGPQGGDDEEHEDRRQERLPAGLGAEGPGDHQGGGARRYVALEAEHDSVHGVVADPCPDRLGVGRRDRHRPRPGDPGAALQRAGDGLALDDHRHVDPGGGGQLPGERVVQVVAGDEGSHRRRRAAVDDGHDRVGREQAGHRRLAGRALGDQHLLGGRRGRAGQVHRLAPNLGEQLVVGVEHHGEVEVALFCVDALAQGRLDGERAAGDQGGLQGRLPAHRPDTIVDGTNPFVIEGGGTRRGAGHAVAVLVAQQPEDIEADQEGSYGQWDDHDADEKGEQLRLQRQNVPLRTRRGTCRLPPTFVGGLSQELYLVPFSDPIPLAYCASPPPIRGTRRGREKAGGGRNSLPVILVGKLSGNHSALPTGE